MITTGEVHVARQVLASRLSWLVQKGPSDEPFLIGTSKDGKNACLKLTEHHQFTWFESAGAERWGRLVFPSG